MLDARCRSLLCAAVGLVAALFSGSWLFTSGLVLDARSLAAAGFSAFYARRRSLQRLYFPASYAFEALVLLFGVATSLAVCFQPSKSRVRVLNAAWTSLVVASIAFLVLLVVANVDAPSEKRRVREGEQQFELAFNAFYCDLRATQLCVDANAGSTLVTMFSTSSSSTVAAAASAAALVWSHCRTLVVSHGAALTAVQNDFLLSCNSTAGVDAWCGELIANGSSSMTPSPFNANPGKLHAFENEWPSRVHLDSIYLGIVLLSVGVLCQLVRSIKDDDGSEEFVAVETKTPGPAKFGAIEKADGSLVELARRF